MKAFALRNILILTGQFLSVGALADQPVDFNNDIRPILTQYCTSCHGGVKQAGDLSFVYPTKVLPPDGWVIEPGDAAASSLIERVTSDDPDLRMPPPDEHPEPLPQEKIELLRRWIDEGAKWGDLWAMAPLQIPNDAFAKEASNVADQWARQSLDRFVAAGWKKHGIAQPSPDAPPEQWLRRVSLDLIGLPPSPEQTSLFQQACLDAKTPAALEQVYANTVDELLSNEHFGERWASLWMDLARYADSKGFEKDPHRDMWPYRDWLIRAFNSDMPYDEFTIKQLAGDLLPDSSADDLIATAFHRNTQTNTEGGTDDEEFRVAAIIDRINTTWTIWQGTTFGCVQCHSHPYDPLEHDEYYASMALFNNTIDADLSNDYPTVKVPADASDRAAGIESQLRHEAARHQRNQLGQNIAAAVDWKPIQPTSVQSSGGRLTVDDDLVRADGGTFPVGVVYTFEAPASAMTGLRIEIFPDGENGNPEKGSVLSHLQAELVSADGKAAPIEFAEVFVDAITGAESPRDVLNKSSTGVGEYPVLHGPRAANLILKQRLDPSSSSFLRLKMKQSASLAGNVATPIRRFRWSQCDDVRLTKLLASNELAESTRNLEETKKQADAVKGASLPVLQSRPAIAQRSTRTFIRGNWMERGDEVAPGIPAVFHSDQYSPVIQDRLQFARWLVSDVNPLAARVWANRIWAQLFGLGLVETEEDFGSSGLAPSHPALLDHLARSLRDKHNWQLKPFLRELVLSSTYRQANQSNEQQRARDPRNRWLGRGPRTRLTAEMVRDHAMVVSGLLTEQMGGPSVMPPQPDGVWQTVYSGAKWKTAQGPDRYRRAIYTYWRRTSPYPSFLTFDSPTRDLCSARRISTNTPLQALVTLNDPVYVECARAMVDRAIAATSESEVESPRIDAILRWMFRAATQHSPNELEINELRSLYVDLRAKATPPGTGNEVDEKTSGGLDHAALAIVANTILNVDKALTK